MAPPIVVNAYSQWLHYTASFLVKNKSGSIATRVLDYQVLIVMPPLWELQDAPELTISDIQTLKHFTMLCLLPVKGYIKMLPLTVHPS